jgi:hypothetical protein
MDQIIFGEVNIFSPDSFTRDEIDFLFESILKVMDYFDIFKPIYSTIKINQYINITLLIVITSCIEPNKPISEMGYFLPIPFLIFKNSYYLISIIHESNLLKIILKFLTIESPNSIIKYV